MAPSDEMVGRRLLLWARRDGGRLARVEYASEFDRERLLQWLKGEGIEIVDIDLPAGETAVAAVDFLLRRLAKVSERVTTGELTAGGVVSVSGFARAFQSQASLADSLRTLNFNREALTAFPLRQIWWMTPVLLETSLHAMPDMHGWFNPQLALPRVTTSGAGRMRAATAMRAEREPLAQSNIEDARQRSGRLLEELEAARESGAAELGLMMTYLVPALEAVAEVGARQELKVLMTRYKDLLSRFYSMTNTEVLTALNREEAASTDTLSLARSLSRLVVVFYQQGLYTEAERMCVRALEIRKAELGTQHPDTAQSLNNLAELYRSQGRYGEAEPLYLEALEIWKAELGDHHPDTATSLNNLALLYYSQGRYGEAEPLYLEALEIRKAELGDRHPDTASSLNNLAGLYDSQGRYGEAKPLYLEALEIYKAELGDRHPDTATSLNNLAALYRSQGRYGEAEPLYLEALEIRKAELGDRHPDTASSLNNLAALYYHTNRLPEAAATMSDVVSIFEDLLGPEHSNTLMVKSNLQAIQQAIDQTT
ncbi:MAG: tetratricopeptide repeat protein [Cyanobacteria bacterium J06634_6]